MDEDLILMKKDPDAKLPFTLDWSTWLATVPGDTLASATWTVEAGMVQETTPAASFTAAGKATQWLSGGTAGVDYAATCRITTSAGRIDDRTITVQVRVR